MMTFRELDKLLRKDGWFLVSTEGSHYHYKHKTKHGKITVPYHTRPKDLEVKIVKTILKQAGLK